MPLSLPIVAAAGLVVALLAGWLWWRGERRRRHDARLAALLDALDALEGTIKRYRERMLAMDAEVRSQGPVSGYRRIDPEAPMQEALRGVLQHRLWIRDHGARASVRELEQALGATVARRDQLDARLAELDTAVEALMAARDAHPAEPRSLH
jgi:hypothetical protein